MRLVLTLVACTAVLSVAGCSSRRPLSNAYSGVEATVGDRCAFGARHEDGSCDVHEVSLAELLSVPEKFHQKKVSVAGYITLEFEGNTLCERNGPGSCLWLDVGELKEPGFRKGWAVVQGTFNGENRGHLGCCAGAIESISRMTRWGR